MNKQINYFELLGLEQKYDLDIALVKKQYLIKQSLYHPDRAKGDLQKKEYTEKSMLLNEAYKILNNDYARAEYILKLNGYEYDDEILKTKLTQNELENILEQYEIIDELEDLASLQKREGEKLLEKKTLIREIASAFKENNFSAALDLTIRLKYFNSLLDNIKLKIKYADNRD